MPYILAQAYFTFIYQPRARFLLREPLLYAFIWKMRLAEALLSSSWNFHVALVDTSPTEREREH